MTMTAEIPVALTIAGSDSGGGAGIQADLKTFAACEVFGTSVVTLVTAQNTKGVDGITMVGEKMVRRQYQSVVEDLKPEAAKTGALGNRGTIEAVARCLEERPIPKLVVDPVMISKHGHALMDEEAFGVMKRAMLPLALVATPNRFEAAALGKMRHVESPGAMREVAKQIYDCGAKYVVVKGGHFDKIVRDIFYDGTGFIEFGADRIDSKRVHGSGCTYSACITARLARGDSVEESVAFAREFISGAIEGAPEVGEGISPVNPMYRWW